VRRVNPGVVKIHRSYTAGELAARLGVHKNSIRNWHGQGLEPVDGTRPLLYQGAHVRAFLAKRNQARKRPCGAGQFFCFRCRRPRAPAGGMVDYEAQNARTGNLRALCEHCATIMHRRVRRDRIAIAMPSLDVKLTEAPARLKGSTAPSLNCDKEREGETR
jgi:hypothetical protein